MENGFALVEGQSFAGEELVIPYQTPDRTVVTQIGSFAFYIVPLHKRLPSHFAYGSFSTSPYFARTSSVPKVS